MDPVREIRKTPPTVKLSLAICLLAGVLLLVFSALKIGEDWRYVGFVAPALWHDLGIALLVSFTVAWLFELYRSSRHQMEAMKDVIDFAMGDKVTGDVWQEVQELIEDKTVIRRNVGIRIEFQRHQQLQGHESILIVEHEYQLYSLRNRRTKAKIVHELDYQFWNAALGLPRWDSVVIEPPEARISGDPVDLTGQTIDVDIKLAPRRDNEAVFVRTRRRELAHLPGSYNFYTPEFMKGLRLNVAEPPDNFCIEVWIRPHGGGEALVDQGLTWSYDQLIFPGQGIEVKFIPKSTERHEMSAADVVTES